MSEYRCNLVVPGIGKSGTSSFHTLLGQHPEICMSTVKEPHYFAIEKNFELGPAHHNGLFEDQSGNAKYFGESSTAYFNWEPALKRIRDLLVDPAIFIVVRNPIDRVISHYRWMYVQGTVEPLFRHADDGRPPKPPGPGQLRSGWKRVSDPGKACRARISRLLP